MYLKFRSGTWIPLNVIASITVNENFNIDINCLFEWISRTTYCSLN